MNTDTNANSRAAIVSQYVAALEMMRQTVEKCPDSLWQSTSLRNQFWRVAYHALFYVHFYLQPSERNFVPWAKHRDEVESSPGRERADARPYSQIEVLEYLDFCVAEVRARTADVDFAAGSGFSWLPFNKLELQLYNLRHLHQHIGELSEQLSDKTGIEIRWVKAGC